MIIIGQVYRTISNTLATFYNSINVQNSLFSISAPCERHVHPSIGDDLPLIMREQNTKGNEALRKSPLLNIHPRKVNRSGIHTWVLYVSLPILLIARRKRKDVSYALTRYRDKLYQIHEDFEDEHKFHANQKYRFWTDVVLTSQNRYELDYYLEGSKPLSNTWY